jgi:hypothetical protein
MCYINGFRIYYKAKPEFNRPAVSCNFYAQRRNRRNGYTVSKIYKQTEQDQTAVNRPEPVDTATFDQPTASGARMPQPPHHIP